MYGAVLGAFLLAAVLYYRGLFRLAGLVGVAFAGGACRLLAHSMGPIAAGVVIVLLVVAPAAFLLVHVLDARRGFFLLPTIYSIPLAFLCGALLVIVSGLALL